MLVRAFTDELIRVRGMFHAQQKKPPLHKNMPPVLSKLMWVHALKLRIEVRFKREFSVILFGHICVIILSGLMDLWVMGIYFHLVHLL